jgi:hypothetical protein
MTLSLVNPHFNAPPRAYAGFLRNDVAMSQYDSSSPLEMQRSCFTAGRNVQEVKHFSITQDRHRGMHAVLIIFMTSILLWKLLWCRGGHP